MSGEGKGKPQMKWGPASLPAPTAPSEGSAKSQNQAPGEPNPEFRLTSSGVAFHRSLPPEEEPGDLYSSAPAEASLLFRAARPDPKVKADRCSAALLGITLSCVPLCPPRPKSLEAASRIRKITSSGASSRLTPLRLPKEPRHCPPRRSDLWSPAAPSFRFRLPGEAWDRRPDHEVTMHLSSESQKRKMRGEACG